MAHPQLRQAIGFISLALLLVLLGCVLAAGLVRTGTVPPPAFTVAIGPIAASGGAAIDTSCPEPWVRCSFDSAERQRRTFYTIWVIYRIELGTGGSRTAPAKHFSFHIPLGN
jgi:hypothetical protein